MSTSASPPPATWSMTSDWRPRNASWPNTRRRVSSARCWCGDDMPARIPAIPGMAYRRTARRRVGETGADGWSAARKRLCAGRAPRTEPVAVSCALRAMSLQQRAQHPGVFLVGLQALGGQVFGRRVVGLVGAVEHVARGPAHRFVALHQLLDHLLPGGGLGGAGFFGDR